MMEPSEVKMPWRGILTVTGGVFVTLTAMCAAALRDEREKIREANRPRWTDKNRWE
jgi:hypothetical protein